MHILGRSHEISFQLYPQSNFLAPHMYTNIHSHQHKITQITYIHLVHTCNVRKFVIVTIWSLIHLSVNWWVHQQTAFRNYSFHTLTSSFLMVFQNSWHILVSILHIYCQKPQNSMFYIGLQKWSKEIQMVYYCFLLVSIW